MKHDGSARRTIDIEARVALLKAATQGELDGLPCPSCGRSCVSVWFTHPTIDLYRTWFVCTACNFEMRAQNSGRPPHYSKDRDRTGRTPAENPAR